MFLVYPPFNPFLMNIQVSYAQLVTTAAYRGRVSIAGAPTWPSLILIINSHPYASGLPFLWHHHCRAQVK